MSRNLPPVIAAIPNYNMGDLLDTLVPEVLEQEYAHVYVLDDASTDHSQEVVRQFGKDVTFVAGKENIGSGGNRNRIIPALAKSALIHYVDADVHLDSADMVTRVREAITVPGTGLVGGLVYDASGRQSLWNYGPRQALYSDIGANVHSALAALGMHAPRVETIGRRILSQFLENWPNPLTEPHRRHTFWVLEANMAISSETLERAGGFDAKIREHDIQDLAIRTQRMGLKSTFDPSFAVIQTNDVDVRGYNRLVAMMKAEAYIQRKNGIREWFLPGGKIKPRYNQ